MKVSLVCIAKNEDKYIQEWIDYYFKLGVDDIHIYMNDWRFHTNQKNVYTYELDGQGMQSTAYNDFIINRSEKNQWVAFFDVDEFLVLKTHSNIKEFIEDYKDENGLGINWVLFGDSGMDPPINDYSVINRFTMRENNVNEHIKTILKISDGVRMHHVHCPNVIISDTNRKKFSGPFNKFGDDKIAQLNHYFTKTYSEYVEKISRGRADMKNGKRSIQDFYGHNKNEIEDMSIINFIKKHNDNNNIFNT